MTPKLLAQAKVCSVLGNICDVSWHLSRCGSELEKRWPFSILDKNGAHKKSLVYMCRLYRQRCSAVVLLKLIELTSLHVRLWAIHFPLFWKTRSWLSVLNTHCNFQRLKTHNVALCKQKCCSLQVFDKYFYIRRAGAYFLNAQRSEPRKCTQFKRTFVFSASKVNQQASKTWP